MSDTIFSHYPLLPFVIQQQHVMEHWQEGSTSTVIPSTSASDVVGQQNKTGGITFRAVLRGTAFATYQQLGTCLDVRRLSPAVTSVT